MAAPERAGLDAVIRLLTIAQAAESLALSERSVRSLIAECSLPVVRLGRAVRIRPEDLRAFVEARREART